MAKKAKKRTAKKAPARKKAAKRPAKKSAPKRSKAAPTKSPAPRAAPSRSGALSFKDGLRYPWGEPKRLWYILWVLVPILGWLALLGFVQKIVRSLIGGNDKTLPDFGSLGENFVDGFWVFVKLIPLIIVYQLVVLVLGFIPVFGWFAIMFIAWILMPYLILHFLNTGKFEDTFALKKTWDTVFGDFVGYLIAMLKTIGFGLIYGVLMLVLVGIPCYAFGSSVFLAEFYRTH